jgi:hypothetical protein
MNLEHIPKQFPRPSSGAVHSPNTRREIQWALCHCDPVIGECIVDSSKKMKVGLPLSGTCAVRTTKASHGVQWKCRSQTRRYGSLFFLRCSTNKSITL